MHGAVEFDREVELRCVSLQVGDHFVARWVAVGVAGEGRGGERVVASRCEEKQRVPATAPGCSDRVSRFEDHEAAPLAREVVAQRQARLTRPDDGDLVSLARRLYRLSGRADRVRVTAAAHAVCPPLAAAGLTLKVSIIPPSWCSAMWQCIIQTPGLSTLSKMSTVSPGSTSTVFFQTNSAPRPRRG